MSWPQNWQTPVPNAIPAGLVNASANYAAGMGFQPGIGMATAVVAPVVTDNFAMQQNWQQWQNYHQQYAEWHAQYGEQYQREMGTSVQPPLPAVVQVAAPPLPVDLASTHQPPPPPPPPDDNVKPPPQSEGMFVVFVGLFVFLYIILFFLYWI